MPLTGTFDYVRIPADDQQPIEIRQADKAGGLSDDELVKQAKLFFHELTGSKSRAQMLETTVDPAERQALAAQVRKQIQEAGGAGPSSAASSSAATTASRLDAMDDDAVLDLIYQSQARPSCDITALTVPVPGNGHQAVSLYAAENAAEHGLPLNPRATALLTACGHAPAAGGGVFGDVFVGRAHDNEATDVWERVDFSVADADPTADWCRIARSRGGGGGSGNQAAAASLSNLMAQQQLGGGGGGGMQLIDGSTQQQQQGASLFGRDGAPPVKESWGSWTQTDDEVELKFSVSSGTKAKYCKINFGRTNLKVAVAGQTLLQGTTFSPLVTDECTFTLQDEKETGRELCVTLSKAETGQTWAWVVRQ